MRYFIITLLALSFTLNAEDAPKLTKEVQGIISTMNDGLTKVRQEALVKLNKQMIETTKKGDLEGALAIRNQMDVIVKELPQIDILGQEVPKTVNPIVGKWMINGQYPQEIKSDGTITGIGDAGKWEIVNNKLIFMWNSGCIDTITLPIKNNIMHGGNNKGQSITATKVITK